MSTDYHHLLKSITGGNSELVMEFFAVFSLFECALKKNGFCKEDNSKYNNAKADWPKFAKEKLNGKLAPIADKDFTAAKKYLLDNPPETQTFAKSDTSIRWKKNFRRSETNSKRSETEEQYLLRLVCDVRNNLFHGGKWPGRDVDESARNSQLLNDCLTVLHKCLSLDAGIDGVFKQALERGS